MDKIGYEDINIAAGIGTITWPAWLRNIVCCLFQRAIRDLELIRESMNVLTLIPDPLQYRNHT